MIRKRRDIAVVMYPGLTASELAGHSYGGVVITGVADRVPERLSQLVYVDAEVPEDGQSEYDLISQGERDAYEESARVRGDGWRIPPPVPETLPEDLDTEVHWVLSRMVPQPVGTFTQPVRLTNPAAAAIPRTYILCTEGKEGQPVPGYVERARANPVWRYRELAAGHAAHVTAPHELADILLGLV